MIENSRILVALRISLGYLLLAALPVARWYYARISSRSQYKVVVDQGYQGDVDIHHDLMDQALLHHELISQRHEGNQRYVDHQDCFGDLAALRPAYAQRLPVKASLPGSVTDTAKDILAREPIIPSKEHGHYSYFGIGLNSKSNILWQNLYFCFIINHKLKSNVFIQ